MSSYKIKAQPDATAAPRDWTLWGSDDEATWEVLDAQMGQSFEANEEKTFVFGPVDFYSDAHPETTSVDGHAYRGEAYESWAAKRSGAGSYGHDDGNTMIVYANYDYNSSNPDRWSNIMRAILLFDTNPIPDGAAITGATLAVTCAGKGNGISWSDSDAGLALVSSAPASNTAIAAADYGTLGATRFATDIAYSGFTVDAVSTFTLNAAGLAAIATGGVTKLGLRFVADLDNTNPPYAATKYAEIDLWSAEKGTTYRPKLTVNYAPPRYAYYKLDVTAGNGANSWDVDTLTLPN